MYIKTTNNQTIQIKDIERESLMRNFHNYPAVRLDFVTEITAAQVEAIVAGGFTLYDDYNTELTTYEGYTTLGKISLVLAQITTTDEERDALAEQNATLTTNLNAVEQKNTELTEALDIVIGGDK